MFKWIGVAFGVLLFLAGGGWALQGMGAWDGGNEWTATFGPLIAGFGVALAWVSWRGLPK
ncbi:hypothetical protein [Nocardioides yefusunii]|uniref:Uncharacterized protein n=1 Tax=Nocardioides yefusunii TaxID=2500546 RepID=A0ABW1QYT3_9ACTN|nr:hypothetical protein [Nocardioides yefusunii]